MAAAEVYFDVVNNRLVKGLNSNEQFVLKWFQGMNVPLKCFPVAPTGNTAQAPFYKKIYTAGQSFELAVGPAAGAEDIKAAQYTWTAVSVADSDGLSGYFNGSIDLNTVAMNAAVAALDKYTTIAEFRLFASGVLQFIVQAPVDIVAVVKDPGSASSTPTPAANYMTVEQAFETFVAWDNRVRAQNAGRNILLVSPDTHSLREIGAGNDQSAVDNSYSI